MESLISDFKQLFKVFEVAGASFPADFLLKPPPCGPPFQRSLFGYSITVEADSPP